MLPAKTWRMLGNRARLPEFLPFIAYDPSTHAFLLRDDKLDADKGLSIGFIIETPPFLSLGPDMEREFHHLITGNLPKDTVIQFGMVASTRIYRVLDAYQECRKGSEHGRNLGRFRTDLYRRFLAQGIVHEDLPVTPRIFRCFLSIRAPITDDEPLAEKMLKVFSAAARKKDTVKKYYEQVNKVRTALDDRVRRFRATIQQLGGHTRMVTADDLIELADEFFNGTFDERRKLPKYDPNNSMLLRDYLISRETVMSVSDDGDAVFNGTVVPMENATSEEREFQKNVIMRGGSEHVVRGGEFAVGVTVASWPEGSNQRLSQMRDFFGSAVDRFQQVPGKFCFFVTINPMPRSGVIANMNAKAFTTRGSADSFLSKINPNALQKAETYQQVQALLNADASITFCKGAFHGVCFGPTKEEAEDRAQRMIQTISNTGFTASKVGQLNPTVVMTSILPMSVGNKGPFNHLSPQTKTSVNWSCAIPWVADWPGMGPPTMIMIGRRGGLQTFDLFRASSTFSFVTAGMTGSGKSFFLNDMINSHVSLDEDVFVAHMDYGMSAARVIENLGGRVIDVAKENIVFNPFAGLDINDEGVVEDLDEIEMLNSIFIKMTHPNGSPNPSTKSLVEEAVRRTVEKEGHEGNPDAVRNELELMRQEFMRDQDKTHAEYCAALAQVMNPFCHRKRGRYAKFFHGRGEDLFANPISSLELESLGDAKDLINVLVNTHISNCFQKVRTLPRNLAKFFLIDEAWRLLTDPAVAEAAELGVRTFRKRRACFGLLTQAISDVIAERPEEQKIPTGRQIWGNVEFKFILMQKPEAVFSAKGSGALHMSDEEWELMANLQKQDGVFSEVFFITGNGRGVSRLIVDRFSYFMYSTKGEEVEMMNRLKAEQGMTDVEAAAWMAENYGN